VEYPISELGMGTLRVTAGIDMTVFPIVLNHAATGHKLQGKSLDELVVAEWSAMKNWASMLCYREFASCQDCSSLHVSRET
jgi:hypothetical protein